MPCRLQVGQKEHRGLVIDLSPTGLFVQTSAGGKPGQQVDLLLSTPQGDELSVIAEVARRKAVPARLLNVAQGGLGLRICNAPETYYRLLAELGLDREAPQAGTPSKRYRVRVSQLSGPRSKRLEIEAEDAEAATAAALEELGTGWKVLGADALD